MRALSWLALFSTLAYITVMLYAADPRLNDYIRQHAALYHRAVRRGVYRYRRGFKMGIDGMMVCNCVVKQFRRRMEQPETSGSPPPPARFE
jgi:hypothetical protein